jgi:outer membrane protein insertion porin family
MRSTIDARVYRPLGDTDMVAMLKVTGGNILGFGGPVAIADNFFKGGETIRGFDTAGIGPRDPVTGDALGGKIFYAGTIEVRFPIPFVPEDFGFSGAIFADAGSLYDTDVNDTEVPGLLDDDTLRSSVGASLLWNSPVGPLRADFAYVITKADFDKEEFFRFGASTKF